MKKNVSDKRVEAPVSSKSRSSSFFVSKFRELLSDEITERKILSNTCTQLRQTFNAESVAILLYSKDGTPPIVTFCPKEAEPIDEFLERPPFSIPIQKGSVVSIEDLSEYSCPTQWSSMTSMPMRFESRICGYVYIFNSENRKFSDADYKLLEEIVEDLLFAISYVRRKIFSDRRYLDMKQSVDRAQSYFSQIGAALSSAMDLNQLLKLIAEMGIRLTGVASATISLIEDGKISIQVHGVNPEQTQLSNIQDTYKPLSISPSEHSYVGIPITLQGEIIAILNLYSSDGKHEFSADQIDLLDSFAKQAGMAIANARNYEKEQKRSRDASLLYEAVRAVGQTLDYNELLKVILTRLAQIAHVDRCMVFLYDKERKCFNFEVASEGLSSEQANFLSGFSVSLDELDHDMWQILSFGSPFVFSPEISMTGLFSQFTQMFPSQSKAMFAPLISRENILGLVYLYDTQLPGKFTQYQIEQIKTISMQISIALQKLVLMHRQEEQTQQLRALLNISSVLPTTRSLSRVVRLVVERASTLINVSSCAVLLNDETGGELSFYDGNNLPTSIESPEIQKRIAKLAFSGRKSYFSSEVAKLADSELKELLYPYVGHVVSIPMILKKKNVGVLNIFSDADAIFRVDQLRFLKSFSEQAAVAIKNASYDAFVKNKLREVAVFFEAVKAMNSSLDFNMVLKIITTIIMKHLECDGLSIMLLEERNHAFGFDENLKVFCSVGLSSKFKSRLFKLTERYVQDVIISGQAVSRTVTNTPPGKYPDILLETGFKTFLSVPMDYRGNTVGIISVYKRVAYEYSDAEIGLLSVLANMASTAIENAKLYEQQCKVAGILQSIVMPQKEFTFKNVDFGYKYIPSGDISGDYFDVLEISDSKFAVVIADVSGKGHSAAIYTVRVKYLIKAYATAGFQPREVLSMVNNIMFAETAEDKFISIFYAEVDTKRNIVKYANAGHESPVFYNASQDKMQLLNADGLLIGIMNDAMFRQEEVHYEQGDILIMFTDGITEACCAEGEFFGVKGVERIVKENPSAKAQVLANKIYAAVKKHTGRSFHDDFSLIVTRL